ncbi:MAG: hypothetical protein KDE59_20140 [Anaerolineales bacterium]|nr:hypothetical protein [Anaerolineales bacterium]
MVEKEITPAVQLRSALSDLRTRFDALSSDEAQSLILFLGLFPDQPEERCRRVVLGKEYAAARWPTIVQELVEAGLISFRADLLHLDPAVGDVISRWGPRHRHDELLNQWARRLGSIYLEAETLRASWQELGQARALADVHFILELMARYSYGYALNAPGLRQFRQDIIRLRELLLEHLSLWPPRNRNEETMFQLLQFWAARLGIQQLAASACEAQIRRGQLCLALRWNKKLPGSHLLSLAADGCLLAVGCQDGTVQVWSPGQDKMLFQTSDSTEPATALALNQRKLFVLRADNQLAKFVIKGEPQQLELPAPLDVVVARQRHQLLVHSLNENGATRLQLEAPILSLTTAGTKVAAVDELGQVFVWELEGPTL